jgi:hypothetical protein
LKERISGGASVYLARLCVGKFRLALAQGRAVRAMCFEKVRVFETQCR